MAECGSEFTDKRSLAMFEVFDEDKSGAVSTREFVVGLAMLKSHGPSAVKLCFELLDADKSGSLDKEELGVLIRAAHEAVDAHSLDRFEEKEKHRAAETMGGTSSADKHAEDTHHDREDQERMFTFRNIASAIDSLDVDHSGKVSFDEFQAGVEREPLLIDLFLHRGIRALTHDDTVARATSESAGRAFSIGGPGTEAEVLVADGSATGGGGEAHTEAGLKGPAVRGATDEVGGKKCIIS